MKMIKILKVDVAGEGQTETLADCGFSSGDVVKAILHESGDAVVDSYNFEKATWSGFIYLDRTEFEVVE